MPHGYDLIFVWGMPYWIQLENQTQWDSADKRVTDIIMTLWSNFAKFSEPTKLGVYIKWDPFTPQNQGGKVKQLCATIYSVIYTHIHTCTNKHV